MIYPKTDKEFRKAISSLKYNLSRRLKRIANKSAADQFAVKAFKTFEKNAPSLRTIKDMKTLQEYYDQLRYISALNTASVKGAERSYQRAEPVLSEVEKLNAAEQEIFWEIYTKTAALYPGMRDARLKYEVWDAALEYVQRGGAYADTAALAIEQAYHDTLMRLPPKVKLDEVGEEFGKYLFQDFENIF